MTAPRAGESIAGYRLGRQLGSGDLGTVHLARNPVLPREDAVKVVHPQLSSNADFVEEFLRSVDTAASLSHPNIAAPYARGAGDKSHWLAMQFVDGGGLEAALAGTSPRDPAVRALARRVVVEVAAALDHAHERRVIHGSVHPGNILLTSANSGNERALLSDFGSGRALDAAGVPRDSRLASPYLAPEVAKGAPYDKSADVYSLGCVLFRMWTGREPEQPRPVVATGELPIAAATVLARAVAHDPAARFGSAGELAAAAVAAHPAPARPVPPTPARVPAKSAPATLERANRLPEQATRTPRRVRRWVGATALVLVAAVTATVAVVSGGAVEGRATRGEPPLQPVPVAELPDLLLDGAQLNRIFGVPMAIKQDEPRLGREPHDVVECAGAFAPGEARAYTTSGYLGVHFQRWEESVPQGGVDGIVPAVSQAVVAFPTAGLAERFLTRELERWANCQNRRMSLTSTQIIFSDLQVVDGVATLKQTLEGGQGIGCSRGITVRNNVSVDVSACFTEDDHAKALTVLGDIANGIPA